MQSILRVFGLGLLAIVPVGCESTNWSWLKPDPGKEILAKPGSAPGAAALVEYLNDNAARVKTLQVEDLAIDASVGGQQFGLPVCRIYAEKPRGFRMTATVLGKQEVDIGSNSNEFWFWAARNADPYQYFCSYKDLDEGRIKMMPLPIQPEWVMETLGLGPYGTADKYQVEADARTLRLVERAKSPTGHPVRKVIVMNRAPVRSPTPQVTDYLLLDDATGQEVCAARILSTTTDRATGAIVPYRLELRIPAQKMKLILKMDGMTLNQRLDVAKFTRPTGVQRFNLATGQLESAALQPVQGLTPR